MRGIKTRLASSARWCLFSRRTSCELRPSSVSVLFAKRTDTPGFAVAIAPTESSFSLSCSNYCQSENGIGRNKFRNSLASSVLILCVITVVRSNSFVDAANASKYFFIMSTNARFTLSFACRSIKLQFIKHFQFSRCVYVRTCCRFYW